MPALTPQTLDWIPRAPVVVTRSKRIAAPVERVWAEIADHASWGEWFRAIEVTPGPVADTPSGTRTVKAGRATLEEKFLAFEPNERFAFTVVSSTLPGVKALAEDVQLTPDGDGTLLTYIQGFDPRAKAILGPLLKRSMGSSLEKALDLLSERVTAQS